MRHNPGPQAHHSEVRKHRRFDLQFPVSLAFSAAEVLGEHEGISQNVSVGGLLVKTPHELPLHTKVKLTMQLSGRESGRVIDYPQRARSFGLSSRNLMAHMPLLLSAVARSLRCGNTFRKRTARK